MLGNETEKLTPHILSKCHQCGAASNIHVNCAFSGCHSLFIQCDSCSSKYDNCCSHACAAFNETKNNEKLKTILGKMKNISSKDVNLDRVSIESSEYREISTLNRLYEYLALSSDNKIPSKLEKYCLNHTNQNLNLNYIIEKCLGIAPKVVHMNAGSWQGSFLTLLAKLVSPKLSLELGTFHGYSAACIANGFNHDGRLISVDYDIKTSRIALSNLSSFKNIQLVCAKYIEFLNNWVKNMPTIQFDFIYVDGDMKNYDIYFDFIISNNLLSKNGVLLFDNVLWKGEVVDVNPKSRMHSSLKAIKMFEFNKKISADTRINKTLIPIRDGLYIVTLKV